MYQTKEPTLFEKIKTGKCINKTWLINRMQLLPAPYHCTNYRRKDKNTLKK